MDQIVFVFDLEQVVPLDYLVEEVEDSLIEARLNSVKQAVLRILNFCSDVGKIGASRRDLPSFGFRFVCNFNQIKIEFTIVFFSDSTVLQNISLFLHN